jgi:Concanavalin A-like lectin/glucanases superfamily
MNHPSANPASICWTALWLFCPIALSAQVTTNCVAPPAGLMAWWPGDGDASDFAGTNNGVLMNGATATASGLVGQAFRFDGVDSYVQLPNLIAGQSEGTVEFWFNVNTWNWTSGCCGVWLWSSTEYLPDSGSSFDAMAIGTHPQASTTGQLLFGIFAGGNWHWANSYLTPKTNQWYHVAGTWGSDGVWIYVNGLLAGVNLSYFGPAPSSVQYNLLGRSSWPGSVTDGLIDEVSIYNRARSANEIASIYFDAGSAGKCKQPVIDVQAQNQPEPMLTFTWAAFAGKAYQVQYRINLAADDWKDLGLPITATNNTASASDTLGSDERRFYRVLLSP